MTDCNTTPCCNLIEREPPQCAAGRVFPDDCADCPDYSAGLSEQERTRCEIWHSHRICAMSKHERQYNES